MYGVCDELSFGVVRLITDFFFIVLQQGFQN